MCAYMCMCVPACANPLEMCVCTVRGGPLLTLRYVPVCEGCARPLCVGFCLCVVCVCICACVCIKREIVCVCVPAYVDPLEVCVCVYVPVCGGFSGDKVCACV